MAHSRSRSERALREEDSTSIGRRIGKAAYIGHDDCGFPAGEDILRVTPGDGLPADLELVVIDGTMDLHAIVASIEQAHEQAAGATIGILVSSRAALPVVARIINRPEAPLLLLKPLTLDQLRAAMAFSHDLTAQRRECHRAIARVIRTLSNSHGLSRAHSSVAPPGGQEIEKMAVPALSAEPAAAPDAAHP